MALPLRTSVLLVVLATSLAPLAGLAYLRMETLQETSEAQAASALENQALAAALRMDAAASAGEDPLAAAATGAPEGATVVLLDRDGNWRAPDGERGSAPALAHLAGERVSGVAEGTDPRTGAPADVAWARAPVADALVIVAVPPFSAPLVDAALLAAVGFLAAGVVVLAALLSRRVVLPVQRLERASRRLAEGAWSERVEPEGGAEVQALAASFNRMADDLARQHAELEEYASDLDRLAADRTRSLQESLADLEALAFTVAHDLREPLRSMRTLAETALEDADSETAQPLALLRDRAARLERVLLDLLRYEDAARRPLETAEVALGPLVLEAARSLAPRAPQVEVGPLPHAQGDAALLREAFAELLRNAADHAGASARVRVHGRVADGRATVFIDDDGPGVPLALREDAFHLFRRLRPDAPGTGVGLALARRVAERHGGTARLEGAPGGGARVAFTFPVAGPPPRAPPPEVAPGRRY